MCYNRYCDKNNCVMIDIVTKIIGGYIYCVIIDIVTKIIGGYVYCVIIDIVTKIIGCYVYCVIIDIVTKNNRLLLCLLCYNRYCDKNHRLDMFIVL